MYYVVSGHISKDTSHPNKSRHYFSCTVLTSHLIKESSLPTGPSQHCSLSTLLHSCSFILRSCLSTSLHFGTTSSTRAHSSSSTSSHLFTSRLHTQSQAPPCTSPPAWLFTHPPPPSLKQEVVLINMLPLIVTITFSNQLLWSLAFITCGYHC